MHNDPDHPHITPKEANDIVSPENTEKLYGLDAIQDDPPASNPGEIDVSLPEDGVPQENMFPSSDDDLTD